MRFRERAGHDESFDVGVYLTAKDSITRLEKSLKGIRKSPDAAWTSIGPERVQGRLDDVVFHPTDPKVMWVASPGGGIWKTVDQGTSWKACDDFLPVMSVSVLAVAPRNPNRLFAGTGTNPRFTGVGMLRSDDGGEKWLPASAPEGSPPRRHIAPVVRMVPDPQNPDTVLCADYFGLVSFREGGKVSEYVFEIPKEGRPMTDLALDPTNPDVVYSSAGDGLHSVGSLWVSRKRGVKGSWEQITLPGLTEKPGTIAIGVAASDGTVYASVGNAKTQGALALYRSRDRGVTWEKVYQVVPNELDYLGYYQHHSERKWSTGQQWYVNAIAVDPRNPDIVLLGGIDLYRSEDGGRTIAKVSRWNEASDPRDLSYVHADIHTIKFSSHDPSTVFATKIGRAHV